MTGLRVKDILRLYEGEPGGVEAIPVGLWGTLKERSLIFSNEPIPVLYMFCFVKTPHLYAMVRRWDVDVGCWRLLGCKGVVPNLATAKYHVNKQTPPVT